MWSESVDFEEAPLLLTVEETARLLKIGRGTAYEMAKNGELPTVRIGRSVRIRRDKLEDFLDALPKK